jgi:hypothetical protein
MLHMLFSVLILISLLSTYYFPPLNFGDNFASASSNTTQTDAFDFQSARQQYLSIWDQIDFQSSFDTFIIPESNQGFGIYEAHTSNIFRPGETLELYIQPVGYTHEPITDGQGNTLYFMNMTADIIISDLQGNQVATVPNLPPFELASHERNTEFLIVVTLTQDGPFPEGDYKIKYIVTDEPSKESFDIIKDIKISNTR